MSRAFAWILAAVAIAATVGLRAQQPPRSGFATSTTAVVVDVVVRDAAGAPVLDLKPSDFELREDDVEQRVTSVQLIAPGRTPAAAGARSAASATDPPPATGAGATPDAGPVDQGPTLIALAFHRLSPDGRALAHRAARSYVDGAIAANDFAGVFIVDTGLQTVQTFTADRRKVADAVEKVARTQTTTFTRQMPFASVYGDASPDVSPTASAESVGRPANDSGFQARPRQSTMTPAQQAEDALRRMAERMENAYEEMMRDRNGHAETAALTAWRAAWASSPAARPSCSSRRACRCQRRSRPSSAP